MEDGDEQQKAILIFEINELLQKLSATRLEHMRDFVTKIVARSWQEVKVTIEREFDFLTTFAP